ncbi:MULTISPECIES: DegT/DnrJ/EryC1/StrS family aminotransferase [Idiomarina]|uniref:DegT/DnrJ/EryC1/StrS family aminotransferase n=1 Tax=Idiomarina TaxID=135575 RepID=UPI000C688A64|nr:MULTISPECIES: DegT/DnrJ/EryC1/StrS family aminotransferase [Idiomarina]MAB22199.1 glutamine--scyllo-inositol aminotransferase [Idiomarina sp.]MBH94372.1 glutamine--scyllo-inositol aminotransferase [Idiomarina sp.]|tara:strand:+ start:8642 stop:9751 length:1110 start_codon:yes stop_codon:yes gene_type:complete
MIKLSQPQIPEEAISDVVSILRNGQLVHGEYCNEFEKELADYLGVKHTLLVSSGTAALHVSLLALGIGPGDAVIVPDFTFTATANVVEMAGAKTVIVDVEETSYNLDPVKLEEKIKSWNGSEQLKAIMPVLEFGNPTNLKRYREIANHYGLHLIEDAACALGASDGELKVGSVGELGCFSFHPRKTLTTGEGGAITTNDSALYEQASLIRNHGMTKTDKGVEFKRIGLNYRLTNFQAAIGRRILPSLDKWISTRGELASYYTDSLKPLEAAGMLKLPEIHDGHSLQTYMIVLNEKFNRDDVIVALKERGIEANLGAQSMTTLGLFSKVNAQSCSVGSNLYRKGLALPLHEHLDFDDISKVVASLICELK